MELASTKSEASAARPQADGRKHLGRRGTAWCLLTFILAIASIISLRGIYDSAITYPDADRIMMDGVFLHDFLHDLPLNRIYQYTIRYYAQYPALSIGYRPPFFPLFESLTNLVFGLHPWASRLALLLFYLPGLAAWFYVVRNIYDEWVAFGATLLLITTPFVAQWTWYTMGEIPVLSMAMITAFLFYRFVHERRPRYIYWCALSLGLAIWTKQTAAVLGLWFLIQLAVVGRLREVLRSRSTWLAFGIFLAFAVPLGIVTMWLGAQNLAQSVGTGNSAVLWTRFKPENLMRLLDTLLNVHLTTPMQALVIVGAVIAVVRRDRRVLFFVTLIAAVYLFFTYIIGKNPRYPIFWMPAFGVLASLPITLRWHRRSAKLFALVLVITVSGWQIRNIYAMPQNVATGYDDAARFVLQRSRSPVVFFDGYYDGLFTYFTRTLDPNRSMFVLRGDKILTSSAITATHLLEVHAQSSDDIRQILDEYGVEYIVVEERDETGLPIHILLRDYLREGSYELVRSIAVRSTMRQLKGQYLLIYRSRRKRAITAKYLRLRLPVVGQTIEVPFRPVRGRNGAGNP